MAPTIVITILNEAHSLSKLLNALAGQTLGPSQILIVDGGSTDAGPDMVRAFAQKYPRLNISLLTKPGNRSVGRNEGIEQALTELVAITDAGCIPQPDWLEKLVAAQHKSGAAVVAGYYTAKPTTPFEEAVVPYALVMPDAVVPDHFLPATRSMLILKSAWLAAGKFDVSLSDNEDYAFAHALVRAQQQITFAREAVVVWQPRNSLRAFAWMIFRFARGDVRAGIIRPKVLLIFARYLIGGAGAIWLIDWAGLSVTLWVSAVAITMYMLWAIKKNLRYVPRGWLWLPVLQIVSDVAVMLGSLAGALQLARSRQR